MQAKVVFLCKKSQNVHTILPNSVWYCNPEDVSAVAAVGIDDPSFDVQQMYGVLFQQK